MLVVGELRLTTSLIHGAEWARAVRGFTLSTLQFTELCNVLTLMVAFCLHSNMHVSSFITTEVIRQAQEGVVYEN